MEEGVSLERNNSPIKTSSNELTQIELSRASFIMENQLRPKEAMVLATLQNPKFYNIVLTMLQYWWN